MSCPSKESADILTREASSKLSEGYTIREARKLNPRIRVVGLSEKREEDVLINYLRLQNSGVFTGDPDMKVVSIEAVGKGRNMESGADRGGRTTIYQAVVQLGAQAYTRALAAGPLFIGYDCCVVYDALDVFRCFNCSAFGHVSRNCRAKIVYPKCSADHSIKNCSSESFKCINCFNASKITPGIKFDHAAWDRTCSIYQKKLKSVREDTLGPR